MTGANLCVNWILIVPVIFEPKKKLTPWLVVRKRTIPTERPPLVSEASANFCG
jgi:hypothetical protein